MTNRIALSPDDEFNQELVNRVHPPDWVNPKPLPIYNLVVLGMGTAGLVAGIGAASMGARVAVVENYLIGGDCLNFGCVPSKAIIRSARVIGECGKSSHYGIDFQGTIEVDFPKVMERMRHLRAEISRHDSQERLQELGIHVFLGQGAFKDRRRIVVDGQALKFKKAVIATGARPTSPQITGLGDGDFLTNETIFSLTQRPESLLIIGGGPLGCELAQAFSRLGCKVTIVEKSHRFLTREDPEAAAILERVFREEQIQVLEAAEVQKVDVSGGKKRTYIKSEDSQQIIEVDEILVGIGRTPNVEKLNLEQAGIEYDLNKGIKVNDFLQTTNAHVYAAGDVCFPHKFTHIADATARIVLQNALFVKTKKHRSLIIPWCTYTDPEIAHVGLQEKDLKDLNIPFETFKKDLKEVDRAILDGEGEGFVKIHVRKGKDKILGATIVASHAGEMISELTQAMISGGGLKTLNNVIHPYPTQSDAIRQTASEYYVHKFSPRLKRLLSRWFQWRR